MNKQNIEEIAADRDMRLRARVQNQRRELRRLNARLLVRGTTSWDAASTWEKVVEARYEASKQCKRREELARLLARWVKASTPEQYAHLAEITERTLVRQASNPANPAAVVPSLAAAPLGIDPAVLAEVFPPGDDQ